VKAYYKNGDNLTAFHREFRSYYKLGRYDRVLLCNAIKTLVESFEETGSALKNQLPEAQQTQRTPHTIEAV
jgi:hypothetical protein